MLAFFFLLRVDEYTASSRERLKKSVISRRHVCRLSRTPVRQCPPDIMCPRPNCDESCSKWMLLYSIVTTTATTQQKRGSLWSVGGEQSKSCGSGDFSSGATSWRVSTVSGWLQPEVRLENHFIHANRSLRSHRTLKLSHCNQVMEFLVPWVLAVAAFRGQLILMLQLPRTSPLEYSGTASVRYLVGSHRWLASVEKWQIQGSRRCRRQYDDPLRRHTRFLGPDVA